MVVLGNIKNSFQKPILDIETLLHYQVYDFFSLNIVLCDAIARLRGSCAAIGHISSLFCFDCFCDMLNNTIRF